MGRALTTSGPTKLKVPEPVMSKQDINNSRGTLPPYSSTNPSTATLVEKQHYQEPPYHEATHNVPLEGPPQGPPQEQTPKDGVPPPNLGVKILEGWALGFTVAT
jgi:hypothetical protein